MGSAPGPAGRRSCQGPEYRGPTPEKLSSSPGGPPRRVATAALLCARFSAVPISHQQLCGSMRQATKACRPSRDRRRRPGSARGGQRRPPWVPRATVTCEVPSARTRARALPPGKESLFLSCASLPRTLPPCLFTVPALGRPSANGGNRNGPTPEHKHGCFQGSAPAQVGLLSLPPP